MPKLNGRPPEHKYTTRSLDVQLVLLEALKAFRNEANAEIVDKEILVLQDRVRGRKTQLLRTLAALGIDVPESWIEV